MLRLGESNSRSFVSLSTQRSQAEPNTNRTPRRPAASPGPEWTASQPQTPALESSHAEGLEDDLASSTLTWRDYDPQGGMPLPGGERDTVEIASIFGNDMDTETGNYVLSVLYWRRVSGALIDSGIGFPKESGITHQQAMAGLEYIRTLEPDFDENSAGQTYVEEEAERVREEMRQRAVKLGIYRPEEEAFDMEEESQQGTEEGRARSGESALQRLREENERSYEQETLAKEREAEIADQAAIHSARGPLELGGGVQPPPSHYLHLISEGTNAISIGRPATEAWLQPVERKPWVKYFEDQATVIKDNVVPQMSAFQRLYPSFIVLALTLGGCYLLGTQYTPPPQSARLFPDVPPSLVTVSTVSGLLAISFLANRFPPAWQLYNRYFCISPGYPNAAGILGAAWRHDTFRHLAINSVVLWGFGPLLHEDVGRGGFLAIYLACGAIGGFSALAFNVFRQRWVTYIYGASGNILGTAAAVCTLHPHGTVQVLGNDVPMSGWTLLAVGLAWVVRGAWIGVAAVDHAGHLAGILSGALIGWNIRRNTMTKEEANTKPGVGDT